jgi:thiamine biosynthesis lipoprotein
MPTVTERRETFPCFGGECTVIVSGAGAEAAAGVSVARRKLLEWHSQFSRFQPDSELSRLNADRRRSVPVTALMRRVVAAAIQAAEDTGGLVDATLLDQIEQAGYRSHLDGASVPLATALALAPARAPAAAHPSGRWRDLEADRLAGVVIRPPGLKIDPGGIAKGVLADELASLLADDDAFALDCAGDIRLGGTAGIARTVEVACPFDRGTLHSFELASGGVATSGIGRRSWLDSRGQSAHHLLDPATGCPAFTGIVQVTALAPTATRAEVLSKAALLSGPEHADRWLTHGGVVVLDDGSYRVTDGQLATPPCHRAPAPARAR